MNNDKISSGNSSTITENIQSLLHKRGFLLALFPIVLFSFHRAITNAKAMLELNKPIDSIKNQINNYLKKTIQYYQYSNLVAFSIFFLIFFIILIVHNFHLFTTLIFEGGDFAANSILINLAKQFQLYVGNYSRIGFNHPGPVFLYIQAIFEVILFDSFHLVPTPFNAHIISIMFLNSFLLAISCYICLDLLKSITKVLSIIAVLLFYFTINPVFLNSTWMPYAYFIPFFTFILSASAVASKRSFFLWSLILTGGILIHGHVSFILITVPIMAVSVLLYISSYQYDIKTFIKDNQLIILASLSLILLFALPILINTIINYPGEFGKYLQYSSNSIQQTPDIKSVLSFFIQFWAIDDIWSINIHNGVIYLLFIMIGTTSIFHTQTDDEIKLFTKNFMLISITASFTFLIYIVKGIDSLTQNNHYTGLFFYAIPVIYLIIILIGLLTWISNNKPTYLLISAIIVIVFLALSGNFQNTERGSPYIEDIIFELQSNPKWNTETIIIDFPHGSWPEVTSLVIALERHGKHPYLSNPDWEFMFTKQYISKNNQDPSKEWHIRVEPPSGNFSNVIYSNSQITLIEENNNNNNNNNTVSNLN